MFLQRMRIRARRRSKAAVLQYSIIPKALESPKMKLGMYNGVTTYDAIPFRTGNRCDYSHSKLRCPWNSGVEPATALFIRRIYEEASLPLNLGLTPPLASMKLGFAAKLGQRCHLPSAFGLRINWPLGTLQSSFSVGKLFDWTISTTVLPHEPSLPAISSISDHSPVINA